jgi:hypothetical protein
VAQNLQFLGLVSKKVMVSEGSSCYTLMMDAIFYLKCHYVKTRPHGLISRTTVIFKVTVTIIISLSIMMFLFTDKINSLALIRGDVNAACVRILTEET